MFEGVWPPAGAHPGRPPLGEVGGRLGGSLGGSVAGLAYILCFWPRDRDGLQRRCGMWPSWPQDTGTEQTVTSRSQSPGAASKRVCRAVWAARVVLTPPGPLCLPVGRGRGLSRSPCSPGSWSLLCHLLLVRAPWWMAVQPPSSVAQRATSLARTPISCRLWIPGSRLAQASPGEGWGYLCLRSGDSC